MALYSCKEEQVHTSIIKFWTYNLYWDWGQCVWMWSYIG